jgi:hypothetical protein
LCFFGVMEKWPLLDRYSFKFQRAFDGKKRQIFFTLVKIYFSSEKFSNELEFYLYLLLIFWFGGLNNFQNNLILYHKIIFNSARLGALTFCSLIRWELFLFFGQNHRHTRDKIYLPLFYVVHVLACNLKMILVDTIISWWGIRGNEGEGKV